MVCLFLLVWLSGSMCFCDTRAAPPAPLLVGYTLVFYQGEGGVVRDILFTESQLSTAAQAFGGLSSFYSSSLKNPLPKISFFLFFPPLLF